MIGDSRVSPDTGQGGHSYLESVSDLVSALIFVFVIMLAVFAYQLANVTEDLTAVTENLTSADETRDQILKDIASRLEDSGMRVEVLYDHGVLRLSDNAINFPSGKETPVAGHHVNVGRLAQAIAEVVPCYVPHERSTFLRREEGDGAPSHCRPPADPSRYTCSKQTFPWLLETLLVEGHTDDVPVAGGNRFRDNIELSSMRAATVHRMITLCEPGVERLLNTNDYPILSTSGYGSTRPASEQAHENRRIDLRFLLEPPKGALSSAETQVQADVREHYGDGRP